MRLAREASTEDIHRSTPGSAVKGLDVVPDGSVIEVAVFDPGLDDSLAIFIPFDIGDRPELGVRVGESESEAESPVSAETVEDVVCGM